MEVQCAFYHQSHFCSVFVGPDHGAESIEGKAENLPVCLDCIFHASFTLFGRGKDFLNEQ